ncbi:hypothetical protein HELRODRAFT_87902, partial [Helobdella robusta]|uniref:Activator 1 subunit 5 n=1 Tax=Helobdella robusta TaxID=6412 RepID=T1G6W5_HELRO
VEKYRPETLDDLISHKEIISTISKFVSDNRLPHLLFYGPPGTGKTSTILAIAKQLYNLQEFSSMVLELNASDDRGIGIVRGQILTFASTRTIFKSRFKLIVLDEADAMTNDAQNALRRVMEKFTENVRFCIICNYLSKIIPALQSRCTKFRFAPLNDEQILPRLDNIIYSERISVSEEAKSTLIALGKGDMRKILNILQSTSMAFQDVNEDSVYACVGYPPKNDIKLVVKWLLNESFTPCYNNIMQLKITRGLALEDILTDINFFFHKVDLPNHIKVVIYEKLAEIEYCLSIGSHEKLQLAAMISIFQIIRSSSNFDC